ncbi:hypothetical protein MTP99_012527 [Tenebrio molitor]|nr:hypothetical protein MTP99_012527 [Tenebrio molitor]
MLGAAITQKSHRRYRLRYYAHVLFVPHPRTEICGGSVPRSSALAGARMLMRPPSDSLQDGILLRMRRFTFPLAKVTISHASASCHGNGRAPAFLTSYNSFYSINPLAERVGLRGQAGTFRTTFEVLIARTD